MKKTYTAPLICPVCKETMELQTVHCQQCQTTIQGHFHVSKFNYLEEETQYFIEIFIKNRGNIKAIEKELNVSYPTVKKLLDEAIIKLGYKVTLDIEEEDDPLQLLKEGKITVEEAANKLKNKEKNNV